MCGLCELFKQAYMCAIVGTSVRCGCHRFCCVDTGNGSLFFFLFCAPCFALVTSAIIALLLDTDSSAFMTCLRYCSWYAPRLKSWWVMTVVICLLLSIRLFPVVHLKSLSASLAKALNTVLVTGKH